MNRDKLGRFVTGNQIAALGWQGLVQRRFQGNELAAKDWLGQLGRWSYGLNYFNRSTGQYAAWVKQPFRQHPGPPEQFFEHYQQRFAFTLADVQERSF